jgi:broad specificity phosphatase PhoE
LSNVYLVRHGQAGSRDDYDSLSELGKQQTRLLGDYFVSQGIQFTAAFCGGMQRQKETVKSVSSAYEEQGLTFPEVVIDERWNEFDLTDIYRELAPALCDLDEEFRKDYEEMRRELKDSGALADADVHRRWRPCDTRLVTAWIGAEIPYGGETWVQFRGRVRSCATSLTNGEANGNILISTSATPTAVLSGLALDIHDARVRQLAGVLYNSSYTALRLRAGQFHLFQFNAVPHLTGAHLLTHR